MSERDCGSERSPRAARSQAKPMRMGGSHGLRQSKQSEVNHKKNRARGINRAGSSRAVVLRTLFARLEARKETMPEAAQGTLFFVAPREVAIQTIKFLRNNFQRAKNANERGGDEFAGHLRILDIRGAALPAANHG